MTLMEEPMILVVDDNPANLDVLFDIFDETNFEVSYVQDGETCLELADTDQPELILLDVMMLEMDGFEVCRRLKANKQTQNIPVIFMTALTNTADKLKGFDLGAVDYITKPIQPEEVLARVKTHLTIQQLQKDLRGKNKELHESFEREKGLNQELQESLERERELNQLKSRFISVASHEVRSPLALISITASMLKRYSDRMTDAKKGEHLELIESEVERITDILNNVLVISKAETGNFQFHPESVDITLFCQDIVKRFEMLSEETHTFTFSTTDKHFHMCVDLNLLKHILSNLLSNAIKYSPAGGSITFELVRNDEETLFRIKDEGIGISETDQQHLFDAFHRGKNVGNITGAGLGLSIVKQFVELHGAAISVESEVNRGTTVSVIIPFR